ncbi:MAG TPA: VWA domain-containing protein [Bdellovibrionales bacterium]|nr:VWA domain-containing protein [Bdellovibrionales bacterium]
MAKFFVVLLTMIAFTVSCATSKKRMSEEDAGAAGNAQYEAAENEAAAEEVDEAEDLAESSVGPEALQSSVPAPVKAKQRAAPDRQALREKKLEQSAADSAAAEGEYGGTEAYDAITDNAFIETLADPVSTFSIDVDTASYANVRRMLNQGRLPPKDAVRIEELINYFPYTYKAPGGRDPISVHVETATAPWSSSGRLVKIGLKGKDLKRDDVKPSNLVFLIDVSGSMNDENKLPLLKRAFRKLVENLEGRDRVSIVVYAGASGVVLEPTTADKKAEILNALDKLESGGSTNGGDGIQLAYKLAQRNFMRDGNNRVILATDGDFNVGVTGKEALSQLIKQKADSGVYITVLGFGMGNYKDSLMETISKDGNGNYFYIDTVREAEKVLVNQLSSTLFAIAKDVKIQVEFNPVFVKSYRLIGYENRMLAAQDFDDDRKDAGEIGAGFTVTALYEIVPQDSVRGGAGDMMKVKMRFKRPEDSTSQLREFPVKPQVLALESASSDFRFASAVAEFGLVLRNSPYKADANLRSALKRAEAALGHDDGGYRREFVGLVRRAMELQGRPLATSYLDD